MPTEAWTDERLDDLAATLRPLPTEVAKVTEAVDRLTNETHSLREDLSASQRQIAQIGWVLAAALVGAVAALIIALL
jgi:uncharacterized protein YoxC